MGALRPSLEIAGAKVHAPVKLLIAPGSVTKVCKKTYRPGAAPAELGQNCTGLALKFLFQGLFETNHFNLKKIMWP